MIKTTWGYTLTQTQSLPDFMTPVDFSAFTNGKYLPTDSRIAANIPSATRSIQNYCGWHIYPSLECEMVYRVHDLRDSFVGSDLLIQLPATFVSSVKLILLNANQSPNDTWQGDATTDFDLDDNGLLRLYDVGYLDKRSKIRVVYDAGVGDEQMDLIKELVANSVIHAMANPYGIASETAGSVSVSYSATWASNTRSTALADDTREILAPFKVKGVF